MPLGRRLRILREGKELSQENVADEFNVTQSAYSRWESGHTDILYLMLWKIADFYDMTITQLLEGIPPPDFNPKKPPD